MLVLALVFLLVGLVVSDLLFDFVQLVAILVVVVVVVAFLVIFVFFLVLVVVVVVVVIVLFILFVILGLFLVAEVDRLAIVAIDHSRSLSFALLATFAASPSHQMQHG